ncbi:MAG TPA: S8 family serine peptidase, partial [Lysobacter sp.]
MQAAEISSSTGFKGEGQAIVFVDTGVRRNGIALEDRVDDDRYVAVDPGRNDMTLDDKVGHGTVVAQIAAGGALGGWPRGVAPAADIVSVRALDDSLADASASQTLDLVAWSSAMTWAGTKGNIVNISGERVSWHAQDVSALVTSLAGLDKQLIVTPAGNGGGAQPSAFASIPELPSSAVTGADPATLRDHWITVAAVDSAAPTRLASYSNACGAAMDHCMVAPGDVYVPADNHSAQETHLRMVSGTDYAAPQVSGASALLSQRFPGMTARQVQETLLLTAKDLGAPGVDPMFGWGLLDAGKGIKGPPRLRTDWDVEVPANAAWLLDNDIDGSGALTIRGGGTVWIRGVAGWQGRTDVVDGTLLMQKAALTAPVDVGAGSVLDVRGGTVRGDITSRGGWLSFSQQTGEASPVIEGDIYNLGGWIWAPTGTTFKGDYVQDASAHYWAYLGRETFHLQGTATLAGELAVVGVNPGFVAPSRYVVLTADGGITGTFSSLYLANSRFLVVANMGQDAHNVWLDVIRADVYATAATLNLAPASIASAIRVEESFDRIEDQGADQAFLRGAAALQNVADAENFDRSLSSLSGELHDMDAAFAMVAVDGNRRAVESRLDAGDTNASRGAWSQRLDATRGWSSFDVSSSGWLLGFDQSARGGTTLGASLSQTDGSAWHAQRYDRERNRQVDAQLYKSWRIGEDGYLLGTAGFGHMQRWLQREVLLGNETYRVSSDYAHRYAALSLQSGRRIPLAGSTITPYVGVQALQLARDGFSEQGASGFGLTTNDATMSAAQAL